MIVVQIIVLLMIKNAERIALVCVSILTIDVAEIFHADYTQ